MGLLFLILGGALVGFGLLQVVCFVIAMASMGDTRPSRKSVWDRPVLLVQRTTWFVDGLQQRLLSPRLRSHPGCLVGGLGGIFIVLGVLLKMHSG